MEPDIFAGLNLARFSGLDISRYRQVLRAVEPASLPAFSGLIDFRGIRLVE